MEKEVSGSIMQVGDFFVVGKWGLEQLLTLHLMENLLCFSQTCIGPTESLVNLSQRHMAEVFDFRCQDDLEFSVY